MLPIEIILRHEQGLRGAGSCYGTRLSANTGARASALRGWIAIGWWLFTLLLSSISAEFFGIRYIVPLASEFLRIQLWTAGMNPAARCLKKRNDARTELTTAQRRSVAGHAEACVAVTTTHGPGLIRPDGVCGLKGATSHDWLRPP